MAAQQAPPSLGFSRQEHWSGLPFPSPMHEKWKVKVRTLSRVRLLGTHGLQPTRLLHPWDFPGKSTRVGCHCLLHQLLWVCSINSVINRRLKQIRKWELFLLLQKSNKLRGSSWESPSKFTTFPSLSGQHHGEHQAVSHFPLAGKPRYWLPDIMEGSAGDVRKAYQYLNHNIWETFVFVLLFLTCS